MNQFDVLRYLLDRVPHSTQDDYDRVAAAIDELENPEAVEADESVPAEPDPAPVKKTPKTKEESK